MKAGFFLLTVTLVASIGAPLQANVISGDPYTFISGIGGPGGFASSLVGSVDSIANNGTESNGTDIFGTAVFSSDNLLTNGGGNFDLLLTLSGGELAPGGFSVGGLPADTAAIFIGAAAGGDPLELLPHQVNFATLEAFDSNGNLLLGGPMDITQSVGTEFTGNLGFSLGAGTTGIGISSYQLRINFSTVPEPTCLAFVALAGFFTGFRRQRSQCQSFQ